MFGTLKTSAYWDPWRDIDTFSGNLEKLLHVFPEMMRETDYPPVNAYSNGDELLFTVEIPGLELEDLDIMVKNDTLTIKGERQLPALGEGASYRRQERGCGSFVRDFALPFKVDPESVEAVYKNGILAVKAVKAQTERPRKISVKTMANA